MERNAKRSDGITATRIANHLPPAPRVEYCLEGIALGFGIHRDFLALGIIRIAVLREPPNGLELSGPAKLLSTGNRALAGSAAASC